MNSVEQQILIQFLDALRREQKKTGDIITGVGSVLVILAMLILWKID